MRLAINEAPDLNLNQSAGSRLGIVVDPDDVRLIPTADDGYIWMRQPEREHLFEKQLSKHSYGAYMELCREIGTSFEAIPKSALTDDESEWNGKVCFERFVLTVI